MIEALRTRGWLWAALLVALFAGRLASIPARVVLDYNEGWNAFHAVHAMARAPLYPAPDAFTGNNYPPLSFYIVGALGRLLGDMIVAGRLVSVLAQVAVGAGIFAIVRRLLPPASPASPASPVPHVAALLFAGFGATLMRPYAAMDDPQWLGHAFMVWGLAAALWGAGRPIPVARAVLAAVLVLAGGLTKHNIIGVPAALGLGLLIYDRRALAVLAGVGLAGLAGALWADQAWFGGHMFADVLGPDRAYAWGRLARHAALLAVWGPGLWLAWPLWRKGYWRARVMMMGAMIAVPVGVVEGSGAGVDINAHFDSLIFLSMVVPLSLSLSRAGRGVLRGLGRGALAVMGLWAMVANVQEIAGLRAGVGAQAPFIAKVAATPGPVACELLAVCYWAGKGFELDFFLYNQRLAKDHGRAALAQALATRRFGAIEVEVWHEGAGHSPLRAMITAAYRPALVQGNRAILVPH